MHNLVDVSRLSNYIKDCVCIYFIAIMSHLLCTHQDLKGEFERNALKFERDHGPNIKDYDLEHILITIKRENKCKRKKI